MIHYSARPTTKTNALMWLAYTFQFKTGVVIMFGKVIAPQRVIAGTSRTSVLVS
jgi:hypothetical protein